jgi:hypothetical protein
MQNKLKVALKQIMKYDFFDENEVQVDISLRKLKTEEELKRVFVDSINAIYYVKDDEQSELRQVDDEQLAKMLGDDVIELYGEVNSITTVDSVSNDVIDKSISALKKQQEKEKKAEKTKKIIEKIKTSEKKEKKQIAQENIQIDNTTNISTKNFNFDNPSPVTRVIMLTCMNESKSDDDILKELTSLNIAINILTVRTQRHIALKTIAYLRYINKLN